MPYSFVYTQMYSNSKKWVIDSMKMGKNVRKLYMKFLHAFVLFDYLFYQI